MAQEQVVQISSCVFTPASGTGVTMETIQSVSYTDGITQTVKTGGDDAIYDTDIKATGASCSGSISAMDQEGFDAVPRGDKGALVYKGVKVSDDSDVTITISDCMMLQVSPSLDSKAAGSVSLSFEAVSSDGSTSPVVWS